MHTMIQRLLCGWKRRRADRSQPRCMGNPTVLRIHIADQECIRNTESCFGRIELLTLGHAYGFGLRSPQIRRYVIVGLHVGVEDSYGCIGGDMTELYGEPALGDQGIQTHRGEEGIKPGVGMRPMCGFPCEGQTGTEDSKEMRFAGGAEKVPTVGGKCGCPFGVTHPDFLQGHNIYMGYDPPDDIPYWCAYPGKPVDIICGKSHIH